MSDTSRNDLDIRKIIAEIDRDRAETQKLFAEVRKFDQEQLKLMAEAGKLGSEARKFDRDRSVQTLLAMTGLVGGLITVGRLLWPGRMP